jgi:hypothetical protein
MIVQETPGASRWGAVLSGATGALGAVLVVGVCTSVGVQVALPLVAPLVVVWVVVPLVSEAVECWWGERCCSVQSAEAAL